MDLPLSTGGLNDICRLCLASGIPMVDVIYLSFPEIKVETTERTMECASIQITKEDELSHLVCRLCLIHLEKVLQFQRQALKSEKTLHHYVQQLRIEDKHSDSEYSIQKLALNSIEPSCTSEMFMKKEEDENIRGEHLFFSEDINRTEETFIKPWASTETYQLNINESKSVNCEFTKVCIKTESIHDSAIQAETNHYAEDTFIIGDNSYIGLEETKTDFNKTESDFDNTFNQFDLNDSSDNYLFDNAVCDVTDLPTTDWPNSPKQLTCDICKKCFTDSNTFETHKQQHGDQKLRQCDTCHKFLSPARSLSDHKKLHAGEKLNRCDVCMKCFTRSNDLKRHSAIHTGEKPYQCEVCNKSFVHLGVFNHHKLLHTAKKHECDECKKCFSGLSDLKKHKLTHTDERPHRCDVCDKSFKQLGNLKIHKLKHTGEKPFQCDVCNRCFLLKRDVKKHKLMHSGVKPYTCDICNKSFTNFHYLKTHKLIHNGEKPHQCDICNRCFTSLNNLIAHKPIHTGEKPYQCNICKKDFNRNQNMKRHKKLIHSEE